MKFKLSILSLLVSLAVCACDNTYGDALNNVSGINVRLLLNTYNNSSNQYLRLGGASADSGNSVAVDSSGNLIVTGYVNGAADLNGDVDTGDSNETPAGVNGNDDIFITKFDISGAYQWSKRLGGTSADSGNSVAVDPSGNVIVTGFVTGTADLNGDGDTLDSYETPAGVNGDEDIFITKFNSSGSHLWSKRLGGTGGDRGYSVAVDSSGNVIVTGYVNGIADLNGDGDTGDSYETPTGGVNGNEDIFISKFNSSGNHLWSKRLGSTVADQGNSVAVDSSGNVVVTGYVVGNADLNGDGDTSDMYEASGANHDDVFISKFNSSGTPQWSRRLGGTQQDRGNSVAADSSGSVIVTGFVTGTADLNSDGDTGDNYETPAGGVNGNEDIFISKFDSSGTHQWSKRLGGTGIDQGNSVAVDLSGNIAVSGYITDYADLDGDMALSGVYPEYNDTSMPALYNLSCDIFVSVFNAQGTPAPGKSQRFGGAYEDKSLGMALYNQDNLLVTGTSNIIIAGYITGKADLNGDAVLSNGYPEYSVAFPAIYSLNDKDIFIIRMYDNTIYHELYLF